MGKKNNDKLPPHDIDAEEAVIGSILIGSTDTYITVMPLLSAEDFYTERGQSCWEVMTALYERGEAINQITVAQELAHRDKLEACGGAAYLSHLVSMVPTHLDCEFYARIVHRLSTSRMLIATGEQIATLGYEAGPDIESAIKKAEEKVVTLHERRAKSTLLKPRDIADYALNRYSKLYSVGDESAIPYGFKELDAETGGAHRGDFIIVGGRPSMGKSSLIQTFANNMAPSVNVLLCSAEMSLAQVLDRDASIATQMPVAVIARGNYNDELFDKVIEFTGRLSERRVFILPRSGSMTTADITAAVRRLKLEEGLDVVIVDYITLLADEYGHNTNERVSYISRKLKGIASDYDVAMIAVSQLSRALEKERRNKRPILADLRDSGSLEQDADVVMFLYRDELYYSEAEWEEMQEHEKTKLPYPKGKAELIIAKQRQRESNIRIYLRWLGRTMQYTDYE